MKKKGISVFAAAAGLALTGCATNGIDKSKQVIESEGQVASDLYAKHNKLSDKVSSVKTVNDIWVAGNAFKLSEKDALPEFFNNPAAYSAFDPVSLQDMITEVSTAIGKRIVLTWDAIGHIAFIETGGGERPAGEGDNSAASVRANLSQTLPGSKVLFQLEHSGTIKSLLDAITIKANLFWKWEDNAIVIFRQETRTFILDAIAGSSEFNALVSSNAEGSSSDGDGSTTTAGLETKVTYAPTDPYGDITAAFDALKSVHGKYSISQQTGTITFTDTPLVLDKVGKYLEELNSIVNKRIAVRAEVYEVTIDDDANVGVDWNLLYSGSEDFSFSLLSTANTSSSGEVPAIDFGVIKNGSDFNGTSSFINALRKKADVSLVTTSSIYTTNGQPAPLQVLDTVAYLKSRKAVMEDDQVAVELEAGTTSEGISMSILPKVTSTNDILMQVAMDLSMIKEIKEFGDQDNRIQLPSRAVKNFLQRVNLESGHTIMISGFERVVNRSNVSSLGDDDMWWLTGKKEGGEKRVMTVILLTPYIMQK